MKLTIQEVELLAMLLGRAGVTPIETMWANMVLNKLRAIATPPTPPADPGTEDEQAIPRNAQGK